MYCKYLSKTLQNGFKCKLYKRQVIYPLCKENCLETKYEANRPIKKVSSKRIIVTKEIYNKVYERDKGCCRLANITCNGRLELHHIVYRSENKNLINELSNCIMLCNRHHRLVHSNKHLWQPILKEIIERK